MDVRSNFKIYITKVHEHKVKKVVECNSFYLCTDLQSGIRTAQNKTAAAAKNNIHLLFNLTCQLWKQAVPLYPKCVLEDSQLEPGKVSYPDAGKVAHSEFRSSEVT